MSTRFREVHQNWSPRTEEPARAEEAGLAAAPRQRVLVLGRTLEPRCRDTWVGVKSRNTNRKVRKRLVFDRLIARFLRFLTSAHRPAAPPVCTNFPVAPGNIHEARAVFPSSEPVVLPLP